MNAPVPRPAGGRLEGRVVVLTGAARGIGEATARRFAREGARLVLNDRDPLDHLDDLDPVVVRGDAVDVASDLAEAACDVHGGIDVVVNNAGSALDAAFTAMAEDDWRSVLHDAFESTVAVTRACLRPMRRAATDELARLGAVAHHRKVSSTVAAAARTGTPGQSNLAAAGGAVAALTATWARELGPFGINCNALLTGFVETRLTAAQGPDDRTGAPEPVRQMTKAMTALGRFGRPEEVAAVHVFLASADADFVTGAVIPVTGGLFGTVG